MKKILFITTSTGLGGAEKTVALIAQGIDKSKFETAGVISLKPEGEYGKRLRAAGMRVDSLEMGRIPTPGDLKKLRRLIAERKPDIVHAFLYSAIQLCRMVKRLDGGDWRLVTSPRAIFRFRGMILTTLDELMKGSDDLLISECEASREFLIEEMGYAPERVITILNGVDLKSMRPQPGERQQARSELGLSDKELLIGTVGRIDPQKDPAALIDAVSGLLEQHPQARLVLVGDGPLRKEMGERVMREGLSDKIFLPGARPEARPWLAAMDLFVLPSRFEGLPNVLLEAMGAGLPVVATAVDGTVEVVEDGRSGVLVPLSDPDALAAAIDRLIQAPAERERLGKAAAAHIAKDFTLERMLKQYEEAYAKL